MLDWRRIIRRSWGQKAKSVTRSAIESSEYLALELVQRARGAGGSAEFRAAALSAFSALVACDNAVFSELGSDQPLITHAVGESELRTMEFCDRNFPRYAAEVGRAMTAAQSRGGVLDHDVFSQSQRSKMAFYAEVMRPQGLESMLVLVPKWRGRALGMIRLQRTTRREFHSEDLALALRLLPAVEVSLVALRSQWPGRDAWQPRLSRRETEVALHVARGLTTPQIALLLGTSKLTVRNQIGRIFDRIGVASRAELAAWVASSQAPRR